MPRLCHPQYAAFVLIMMGFLFQSPSLPTLILFPILTLGYLHLARQEEAEAKAQFWSAYLQYASKTPAFFPRVISGGPAGT